MDFSILFKILLIIIFFVGMILYATDRLKLGIDGFKNNNDNDCPDLLIQNGEIYYLYNSKKPNVKGSNPRVFSKLSDYEKFVLENPSCPVLYLQKVNDTQGKDVYKIRGGTPMNLSSYNGFDQIPPLANGEKILNIKTIGPVKTINYIDANLNNPPYNMNQYNAFDPYGYDIGRFDQLDAIHISERILPVSTSANDTNWGGTEYTEERVNAGDFLNNEVYRPVYSKTLIK